MEVTFASRHAACLTDSLSGAILHATLFVVCPKWMQVDHSFSLIYHPDVLWPEESLCDNVILAHVKK